MPQKVPFPKEKSTVVFAYVRLVRQIKNERSPKCKAIFLMGHLLSSRWAESGTGKAE